MHLKAAAFFRLYLGATQRQQKLKQLVFVLALLPIATVVQADTINDVTGYYPLTSPDPREMYLQITVDGIEDFGTSTRDYIAENLIIRLRQHPDGTGDDRRIQFEVNQSSEGTFYEDYFLKFRDDPVSTDSTANNTTTLTFNLAVDDGNSTAGLLEIIGGTPSADGTLPSFATSIDIDVGWGTNAEITYNIPVRVGRTTDVPTITEITSLSNATQLTWTQPTTVNHDNEEGTREPEGTVIIAIQRSLTTAGTYEIIAEQFSETEKIPGTRTTGACTVSDIIDSGGPCISCPENFSIDFSALSNAPQTGVETLTVDHPLASATISGLTNDEDYLVALVWLPFGDASSCEITSPYQNYTSSELLTGDVATDPKNPDCFITTAAFGDPDHPLVEVFRQFRNRVLLQHRLGQEAVRFYYKHSPDLARIIASYDPLRWVVLAMLIPLGMLLLAAPIMAPIAGCLILRRLGQQVYKSSHQTPHQP